MKLVKMKLINWHIFSNHTIEFNGNTLITGENACGKSTVLDALYYVLSGGDTKHFNKAANESGQRNLETYVRAKLGTEKTMYLRSGSDVISYIILEFQDKKESNFVIGSEIEVTSLGSKPKSRFFSINKYKINDDDFIKDKKPIDYKTLKANFNVSSYEFSDLGDSHSEIRKKIGRDIFKLVDWKRFFDLLQRAISFHPISEVSSFVNGFLLEEDEINLSSLREEIRSYREIHKALINEKEKISFLENFISKAEKYRNNELNLKYFNVLRVQANIDYNENELEKNKIELSKLEAIKSDLEIKEKSLQDDSNRLTLEISQLRNNEEYKAFLNKKERLKSFEIEAKNLNEQLNKFSELIFKEQKISKTLGLKYRFDEDYKNQDYGVLRAHLESYEREIKDLDNNLRNDRANVNNKINNIKNEISEKEIELENLKRGINNYPNDVINLINIAKEAIKSFNPNEKNLNVKPFCEYINIVNKKWADALEGYLNTQRFNLIIEPRYYDVVAKAIKEHKNDMSVYVSGIVNVEKIPEIKVEENSMMGNIQIENKWANQYAKYLLGNLICVDDVLDLKKYKSSITPEVIIYKNYVLKACDPKIYKKPFIGRDSIKQRILLLENEISDLKNQLFNENKNLDEFNNKLNILLESKLTDILNTQNLWSKINLTNENIESLKVEIKNDEKNKDLAGLSERLGNAENNKNRIDREINTIRNQLSNNDVRKGEINSKISSITSLIEGLNNEFNSAIKYLDDKMYQEMYEKYSFNGKLNSKKINDEAESAQGYNSSVKNNLITFMSDYTSKYKPSLSPLIENIEDYIYEYNYIKNREVVDFEQDAKDAYEKAESSFREDFISKLREKIEKSQRTLDKINKNLALHPFGNDGEIYKFYYEATKNSEFYNYYRIIMSGKLMESKDLFTEILDEKDLSYMKDLFDKISMEVSSSEQEKEFRRYLDYRNYMNYDIKITNKYGDESYFSKINREKSGGETQTPFYIVIASCFDELMNKKDAREESTCVVVFDEAFNNMDEGRIKSLMEFYKQLNIQLIIIVPSNRISSISPYMDTIIGIVKSNNYPCIREMLRDQRNE